MNIRTISSIISARPLLATICCLASIISASVGQAGPAMPPVNAFYVKKIPDTYAVQEKFFASFRNAGINTAIIELPLTENGYPKIDVVPNAVFLAHQAGVKLQVVLPTRGLTGPIIDHEDWEDRAYDLNSDGYRRANKLDLFNPEVVDYLAGLAKKISSYSVDGLLLGTDFIYEPLEGMSRAAAKFAKVKLNADIEPADMYKKLGKSPEGRFIQEYSDLFLKWAVVKRDRLLTVYDSIKTAARKANGSVTFGVAIPVVYPLATPRDMLSRLSFDLDEYRKKDADYYLVSIDYRSLQEAQNLNYRQATEMVSRVSRSVFTAAKDGRKVIIILPMTERLTAKSLRLSEIEEMSSVVRSVGDMGVGFVIKAETELSPQFTNKLFKKQ
jgi:hypothetical protein